MTGVQTCALPIYPIYEDAGPTPRFMELTRRNQKKLKTELKKG